MRANITLLFIPFLLVYILFNRIDDLQTRSFQYDKLGYHSYLPAVFIYNDLANLSFYPEINARYPQMNTNGDWFAVYEQPNGRVVNKYAIGASILELPFFLLSHAYARAGSDHLADGFSMPYQVGVALADIFWVAMGLVLLRNFLRRYYRDGVVAATLICIALGTNLYHYSALDYGMSHPYSFFLFAAVLYLTDRWYSTSRPDALYWLAFILGLVTITRPVNMVVAIVPLLWGIRDVPSAKTSFIFWRQQSIHILVAAVIFAAVLFIQLGYWKYVTGSWIHYSYKGERFAFTDPMIWKGLFSWRKGWFIYTPIAFVGMLGLLSLYKTRSSHWPAIVAFLIAMVYIVFSWECWWYGGSLGCRAMIESLAIVAFPLAAFINEIYKLRQQALKLAAVIVLLFFISLNMFQSYQFAHNVLLWDRTTRPYYFAIFGKVKVDHNQVDQYLLTEEESHQR